MSPKVDNSTRQGRLRHLAASAYANCASSLRDLSCLNQTEQKKKRRNLEEAGWPPLFWYPCASQPDIQNQGFASINWNLEVGIKAMELGSTT